MGCIVRFAHMDEAGTGNVAKNPFDIVAGVITHADRNWKRIERYLRNLAGEFFRKARCRLRMAMPTVKTVVVIEALDYAHSGRPVIVGIGRAPFKLTVL
jgi:hypothetical protein